MENLTGGGDKASSVIGPHVPSQGLTPTIFHEAWWLEAASPGNHGLAEVRLSSGAVARLPYSIRRLAGLRECGSPILTRCLGPAIQTVSTGRDPVRALEYDGLMRELFHRLPPCNSFSQTFHAGIQDTIMLQAMGFQAQASFTFEISAQPQHIHWSRMRGKTRNLIRAAARTMEPRLIADVDEYVQFYARQIAAKGERNWYPQKATQRICTAAVERGRGAVYGVRDAQGTLMAATFCVWDEGRTYYLMSGRMPQSPPGVIPLLIWTALGHSGERGTLFDFDGVGIPGARLLYTGFGARRSLRFKIDRRDMLWNAFDGVRRLCRPIYSNLAWLS